MGSVRDAFRAGRKPASVVADSRIATMAAKVGGSVGSIPLRREAMEREATNEPIPPIRTPILARAMVLATTRPRTCTPDSPRAIRIPISGTRRLTE